MPKLSIGEFKSVLAHEFAHFSGYDTLYSTFVYPVYLSLQTALNILNESSSEKSESIGTAVFNLLLLLPKFILGVYLNYFSIIDMSLSRSRELRADWVASKFYGSNVFSSALKKIVSVSTHYNEAAYDLALNAQDNFFEHYQICLNKDKEKIEEYANNEMKQEGEIFDSHPTLYERLHVIPLNENSQENDTMDILLKDLENQIKELSLEFTNGIKAIKQYYEKIAELIENAKQEAQNPSIGDKALICPQCGKDYDNSWKICLTCSKELIPNSNYKPVANATK